MATINALPAAGNTAITYVAASAGGDTISFGTSQRAVIFVRNASGSSINLTMTAVQACNQGFLHNVVTVCAIGDTEILIPQACITPTGTCAVTYSASASVTVAAVTS